MFPYINYLTSEWMVISKGATQGSIFGPFGYNIISSDLLLYKFILSHCYIYNYADDNTSLCTCNTLIETKSRLFNILNMMKGWLKGNEMKVNIHFKLFSLINVMSTEMNILEWNNLKNKLPSKC